MQLPFKGSSYKEKYSKVVPIHAMKGCRGIGGTDPLFLNIGARWKRVESDVSHIDSFAAAGRAPNTQMDTRLGGTESPF